MAILGRVWCNWCQLLILGISLVLFSIHLDGATLPVEWEMEDEMNQNETDLYIFEEDLQTFYKMEGESVTLECTAVGNPTPKIKWTKTDGKNLAVLGIDIKIVKHSLSVSKENLVINRIQDSHKGSYRCSATNGGDNSVHITYTLDIGIATTKKTRNSDPPGSDNGATISVVITVVIVTLLGVGLWSELLRRKNRHGLSKRDVELFLKGNPEAQKKGYAHENAMYMAYDSSYELDEDKLKIDKDDILGAGVYGQVVRAKYDGETVAVKMVKPGADKSYLKALLTELKIMIHIGRHPFISELIGACSKDLRRGMLNVVVTLYPLGNVENYLRNRRYTFVNLFEESGNINYSSVIKGDLTTRDLLRWSYQIAEGMEYLGNRNIIHGDLAARNILLDKDKIAKITDFGLARKMYDYANYVKRHQEPLPWRWMAIESLRELNFSPKSDIWSYGVLLWELFTCGDVPYPGHSWTTNFVDKLLDGLRLPRPKYASKELYRGIMDNCWQLKPEDRILFSTISLYLKPMVESFSKQN